METRPSTSRYTFDGGLFPTEEPNRQFVDCVNSGDHDFVTALLDCLRNNSGTGQDNRRPQKKLCAVTMMETVDILTTTVTIMKTVD